LLDFERRIGSVVCSSRGGDRNPATVRSTGAASRAAGISRTSGQ